IRTADIGQKNLPVLLWSNTAVQPADVSVLREEDIAALPSAVYSAAWDGEGVARRVTADDQREAPHVSVARATKSFDSVRAGRLLFQSFELDDFLADSEHIAEV